MENLTPKLDPRDVNLKGEVAKGAKSLLATNRLWHLACGVPSFVEKLASRVWRAKKKKKEKKKKGEREPITTFLTCSLVSQARDKEGEATVKAKWLLFLASPRGNLVPKAS